MVFNATFNNILIISWQSVLLLTEFPEKTTDMQYSIKTCYTLSKYCNDPNVVNYPNIVNDHNIVNSPKVVNGPNIVNSSNVRVYGI
jgi:hypothetical protein